jgi:hypothetical protein
MEDKDNIYLGLNGDYIIPKIDGEDFIYLICQRGMVKVRVRIRPKELKRFCENMLRKIERYYGNMEV